MVDANQQSGHDFDNLSQLVIGAISKIFSSMFDQEVKELDIAPTDDLAEDGVVLAVISLVGDVDWSIWLGFPRNVATSSTQAFIGVEISFEETEDIADAVGEVANMIAGDVKASLSDKGIKTVISLPNVIAGKNIQIWASEESPTRKIRYSCVWGDFWVQLVAGVVKGSADSTGS